MKNTTLLAILAFSVTAHASMFYDNGGPNQQNGNEMAEWTQSEDVPFTANQQVFNKLVFWTIEGGTAMTSVRVDFSYDDGFGNPGTIAVSLPGLSLSRVATGQNPFGLTEYENTVMLGDIYEQGSGIFHMELTANDTTNPNHSRQEIYWETTNLNGTNTGRESDLGTRNNWFDNGQEHAFNLQYEAVPEPASMTILGMGALTLIRRRRSK